MSGGPNRKFLSQIKKQAGFVMARLFMSILTAAYQAFGLILPWL
jgi:hypothetical protein